MNERRQYIRIPESTEISYRLIPETKVSGYLTRDISRGGICFLVHEFLPVGSILKVKLRLKKNYFTFEALVKVKWVKEDTSANRFEIGVEFTDIPPEASRYLVSYIRAIVT